MLVILLYLKSVLYRKARYRKHNIFLNHMTIAYIRPNFWFMVLYSIYAKLLVLFRKSNFLRKYYLRQVTHHILEGYSRHPAHKGKFMTVVDDVLKMGSIAVCKTMKQSFPPCGNVLHQGEHRWLASNKYTEDMPKYPKIFQNGV